MYQTPLIAAISAITTTATSASAPMRSATHLNTRALALSVSDAVAANAKDRERPA